MLGDDDEDVLEIARRDSLPDEARVQEKRVTAREEVVETTRTVGNTRTVAYDDRHGPCPHAIQHHTIVRSKSAHLAAAHVLRAVRCLHLHARLSVYGSLLLLT